MPLPEVRRETSTEDLVKPMKGELWWLRWASMRAQLYSYRIDHAIAFRRGMRPAAERFGKGSYWKVIDGRIHFMVQES